MNMEHGTTFWLTTASSETAPELATTPIETDDQRSKTGDLSAMFNQPAVLSFATIFAGASAAASPGTTSLVAGQRVPSLSHIGISPTKLLPVNNAQTIPSINQLTPRPQSQIPSTSTIVVSSLNGVVPLPTAIYTLPLPTEPIQVPKNFIQEAAAASGLEASSTCLRSSAANDILIAPSNTETMTTQNSQAVLPESAPPAQTVPLRMPLSTTFQCSECGKNFENSGQLSYHTFVSHGELQARPHKCTCCPESFLMDHHLQDHMKAIHLSPDQGGGPPFVCSECMASFSDGGHLNFHLYMAHTIQGSKPAHQQFPCPECGKNFIKTALRAAHIRNVHSGQVSALNPLNQVQIQSTPAEVKTNKCTECNKSFKTQSYLKQHVMSVHEKPLKCTVCERGFGRKSDLKRHVRGVHMKKRPHQCTKCGWTFSEVGNLKHHLQAVHQKEKNFRCMYCDKTFSLSSYLRTHLVRMHNVNLDNLKTPVSSEQDEVLQIEQAVQPVVSPETSQQVVEMSSNVSTTDKSIALPTFQISIAQAHVARCFECGQTFQNTQMLQDHVMSTHPHPFWCTVCGEAFTFATHLQLHLQLRHASNEQGNAVQTVQAIGLQNNGQIALEIHESPPAPQAITASQLAIAPQPPCNGIPPSPVTQQQPTSQSNIVTLAQTQQTTDGLMQTEKCNLCGIIYNAAEDHTCWRKLPVVNQVGLSDVAMAGDRPHSCGECGKGFKTATHLKQHMRCVHSKERPHKCSQCEKCFARTSDLNRHMKGVHQRLKCIRNTVFVTLKCSECGAIYAETSQLKRHIYTHHMQGRPSYKCADCQEGFIDESAFQTHICHEEERPNVCTVCSKRFQMTQQLRRHMRAAHGRHSEEPQLHRCFQCERIFGRPIDLERHIQAVHLKEKPHKCTLCGKTFGLQGNLNKHVRAVHLLEKPHQCIECGKRFAHVGVLKRHLRDIHFYDKKASVKQKLAQMQMRNARAIMCNIANLRSDTAEIQTQPSQQRETPPSVQATNTFQQQQIVQTIGQQQSPIPQTLQAVQQTQLIQDTQQQVVEAR